MPQPPNFNKMLKQVQQMQADMAAAQDELKQEIVEASAGGAWWWSRSRVTSR